LVNSQLLLIHNNNNKVYVCVCMGNYITDQRKQRIDFLCQESASFTNWEDFQRFAFEYLFRNCGLTIEKIEQDYLQGLKAICTDSTGAYTKQEV